LFQQRADALRISSEVERRVARGRTNIDARRLIFVEHANDDVIDQPQDERVIGELDEARSVLLRLRRQFQRRLVLELPQRLQHQFVSIVRRPRQNEAFDIRIAGAL
jgi:hypothetical protein